MVIFEARYEKKSQNVSEDFYLKISLRIELKVSYIYILTLETFSFFQWDYFYFVPLSYRSRFRRFSTQNLFTCIELKIFSNTLGTFSSFFDYYFNKYFRNVCVCVCLKNMKIFEKDLPNSTVELPKLSLE
jgi:hypothetical protein